VKNLTATICLTITLLLGSVGASWSADWNKGLTAFKSGDYATALREWTPLADKGNARAQNAMGSMYKQGLGVPKDDNTAVKWYRLSAENGEKRGQFSLGLMYASGKGVPLDYKTALKWWTLAAKQGHARAQWNLGVMYEDGDVGPKDYKTAVKWYTLAAKQGFANAQSSLIKIKKLIKVEEKERTKHPRALSNYYLGDLILEKCVGSGLVSKAILDDWRVRTKRLFELYFEDKNMNIRPSDRDNIKNTAYRFAQDKYNSSSWKILESVANFGGQLSNANYMKLSSGCSDFLNLANASVNSLLNAFGNESGRMKKKPF
jgi:hypothetical protein